MAFNFPDGASNGQTHTASNGTVYRYNGTTWVVDSASTTSNFDTRYLNTNGDGILSGSVTDQLPSGTVSGSSQITDGSGILSGSISSQLPSGTISGSAQIDRTWTLGADGSSNYTFTGPGLTGTENDPTLYLTRGETYRFIHPMGSHPFRIQSDPNGSPGTQYSDGVSSNDVTNGTIIWDVQFDSPSKLYYQCVSHNSMGGVFEILDKLPSGVVSGSVTDQLPSGVISGSSQITNGSNIISGSTQISNLGYVSSSTVDTIQVMTTASYQAITPVSGTLYIIQG